MTTSIRSAMRNGSFELRTVTTGNEGKVARQLDAAVITLDALLDAAQEVLSACDDHIQAADSDCAMCRALAALAEAVHKANGETA